MDEQPDYASGGVPHAYRQALSWRWAPSMPSALRRGGFLTVLYALSAMADTAGRLRFARGGDVIRQRVLADASGCDVKDLRRYLTAAVSAGVLDAKAAPGQPTLYTLVVSPAPDWPAAEGALTKTKRVRKGRPAAPWRDEGKGNLGGRSPEVGEGDRPPTYPGGPPPYPVGGTAPLPTSGDRPPGTEGDRPPDNPGSTHVLPHDVVASRTQLAYARAHEPLPAEERPALRALDGVADPPTSDGVRPLLLAVRSGEPLPRRLSETEREELYAACVADPALVLAVLEEHGDRYAVATFGGRLVAHALTWARTKIS